MKTERFISLLLFLGIACTPTKNPQEPESERISLAWTNPVYWRTEGVDQALGIAPFDQTSVVVVGRTEGGLGDSDAFASRVAQDGQIMWTQILGSSGVDLFLDVGVHVSGQIFAAGVSTGDFQGQPNGLFSDGALSSLGADGEVVWSRLVGLGAINQLEVVDDGVLVTGSGMQSGRFDADAFVAKFSLDGDRLWVQWMGDEGMESATGIAHRDGLIGVVGFRDDGMSGTSGAGTLDGWVSLLEADGQPIDTKTWDLGANESLTRVCLQPDGTMVAAGYTDVYDDIDALVVTFDDAQNELKKWVSRWEGVDAAYSLLCDENDSVYIAGRLDTDERSDAFWALLGDDLLEREKRVEDYPGRDEWVDLFFWHDHLCAAGYRKKNASTNEKDVDALFDCMPRTVEP